MVDNIRKISGGVSNDVGAEITQVATTTGISIFQRAVVYEVLDNLTLRDYTDEEFLDSAEINLTNPEDLPIAPRNSIIVQYVSSGKGRADLSQTVCFPFFSSHLSLPLKVGEQVWIMVETPDQPGARGYWLSRIHEPVFVEDVNYTHGDRRYDPLTKDSNKSIDADDNEVDLTTFPTFHNGKDKTMFDPDQFTIAGSDTYEAVFTGSLEANSFVIEPVPRLTKRPGDLVIQGSHNSAIILGTDRGYKAGDKLEREKSNAEIPEPLTPGKGAIDIVVGRGRIFAESVDKLDGGEEREIEPTRTEPRVIKNESGLPAPEEGGEPPEGRGEFYEVDKNISVAKKDKSNNRTDGSEGDPDFVNDAARIYLTMNSNPDEEFNIIPDNIPQPFASEPAAIEAAAATVVKADEIRIIARKTGLDSQKSDEMSGDNEDKKETNGSIRIIKEGVRDDDSASIYILPDGTIQISGKVVYIGRTSDDGGKEDGSGEKGSEPYLRMSDFEKWADGLIDAINTAFETAEAGINANGDAINTMASAGSGPGVAVGGATPGFGAPNSALGGAVAGAFAGGIAPAGMSGMHMHAPDKSAIEEFKSTKDAMEAIKSERIFGE